MEQHSLGLPEARLIVAVEAHLGVAEVAEVAAGVNTHHYRVTLFLGLS